MNTLDKVGVILGVILFAVLCFWWVNIIIARDSATIKRYEAVCGSDYDNIETVICLRKVYYQYNVK